jgi:hypothetical protein
VQRWFQISDPLSYVRYHWNPKPVCNKSHCVSLFHIYWYIDILLNFFWHTDKKLFSACKLTFEISQGTTRVRLNETRFDPKKCHPRYISAQNISTLFWCTGWAWNWQIMFRFASNHGRACFILQKNNKHKDSCIRNWNHKNSITQTTKCIKYFDTLSCNICRIKEIYAVSRKSTKDNYTWTLKVKSKHGYIYNIYIYTSEN